jgi:hypothetical protein
MDREQLIRADAEAPVAELLRERFEIALLAIQAIDENKIVAATVHLGEMQLAHI